MATIADTNALIERNLKRVSIDLTLETAEFRLGKFDDKAHVCRPHLGTPLCGTKTAAPVPTVGTTLPCKQCFELAGKTIAKGTR